VLGDEIACGFDDESARIFAFALAPCRGSHKGGKGLCVTPAHELNGVQSNRKTPRRHDFVTRGRRSGSGAAPGH
jgi:hypothetical protein